MVESAGQRQHSLRGKTLYIPRMGEESARLFAAAFRSVGVDARMTPASDATTRAWGSRYLNGEECSPAQVTLGNFIRVVEMDDFDPEQVCFFMPMAEGPCRFGQYSTLFRQVFEEMGMPDVQIISPSSRYGYGELRELDSNFERNGWRALVTADILRKLRLMIRPYEVEAGATDRLVEEAVVACEEVLSEEGVRQGKRLQKLVSTLIVHRDRLRRLPRRQEDRPLIGVVGEIFCRLDDYSNSQILKRIEDLGGEAWLADISEWVHYTRFSREDLARQMGKSGGVKMVKMKIAAAIQAADEKALLKPFTEDFTGREEPHDLEEFLELGEPYLPHRGCLGEMALSVAKAIYMKEKGAAGVLDISPFTCMNGIISEAVYPRVSRDHDGFPIRNLYFDGTESDIDRDLGMFLDLTRSYQRRQSNAATSA
jgi:predicted nucleotide-binding protein (sugar kinase/HSP70/actin superfamily)